jgi:hypothetical protein
MMVSPRNFLHKEDPQEVEEAPYCTFSLSMDKVRYTSFKFKVWEDQLYLAEKTKRAAQPFLEKNKPLNHHDDFS